MALAKYKALHRVKFQATAEEQTPVQVEPWETFIADDLLVDDLVVAGAIEFIEEVAEEAPEKAAKAAKAAE